MVVGGLLFAVGLIVRFAPGLVSWFGNLPGDIHIESENTRVFIPITSMLIVSVVASVVIAVLRNR